MPRRFKNIPSKLKNLLQNSALNRQNKLDNKQQESSIHHVKKKQSSTNNNQNEKHPSKPEVTNLKAIKSANKEDYKTNKDASTQKQTNKKDKTNVTAYTGATKILTNTRSTNSQKEKLAHLILLHGPKDLLGLFWPLSNTITKIGRSTHLNDISIKHDSLSKSHFQILKENDKFFLIDLKSTNKTYINDKMIEPYQKVSLRHNNYIRASNLIFKFLDKENIELFSSKQMLKKAQTDPLTGAGNRELLKIKGSEYFIFSKQLSLIVFDVDSFKTINNNFGHIAGDYVLQMISARVIEIIRPKDMFIRYGGDEFCIFTPNNLSTAKIIANRIQQSVCSSTFTFKKHKITVDISIGVAGKSPGDRAWEDIYHRADQKSYQYKKTKKNNVADCA